MCYYAQRGAQFTDLEVETNLGKRWGMRWPNSKYEKWKYWHHYQSRRPLRFFLDQAWGHMSKSYDLFWEWVSCNLFEINGSWPLLEILGIKFFTIAFASCIFTLKECMHLSICVVFCIIKLFQKKKKPYYPVRRHQNFQWQNCKKIAPSNPNWLEFGHCKVFGAHKARKRPEITSLT